MQQGRQASQYPLIMFAFAAPERLPSTNRIAALPVGVNEHHQTGITSSSMPLISISTHGGAVHACHGHDHGLSQVGRDGDNPARGFRPSNTRPEDRQG